MGISAAKTRTFMPILARFIFMDYMVRDNTKNPESKRFGW